MRGLFRIRFRTFILIAMLVASMTLVACAGADGTAGSNGAPGKDGAAGPAGPAGPAGADGDDGKDGSNGSDGKDGADGEDGASGTDGKDGTNGKDGAKGKDGADGADGADGKDGTTDVGGISVVGGQVEALETVDENGNSTWSAVVTVIGGGFEKGSVTIDSSASGVSGSATANSDGAFSETFTMEVTPDDLDVPITITASAGSKLASTGFVVVNNEDNWVRAE